MDRTGLIALLVGAIGGLALVTVRWPRLALGSDRLWVTAVTGALVGFLVRAALGGLWRATPPQDRHRRSTRRDR